jgi:hypothetical protein
MSIAVLLHHLQTQVGKQGTVWGTLTAIVKQEGAVGLYK